MFEQQQPNGSPSAMTALAARRARDPREVDVVRGALPPAGHAAAGPNILTVFWRRRWIIVGCVVVALIAGAAYLSRAVPIFASASILYVQQTLPKAVSDGLSESSGSGGSYLATQCQLIQSTAILRGASEMPEMAGVRMLHGSENPVGLLKSVVSAAVTKQGDLISVSAESVDPHDAATVVNAVVQAYIDYQSKQHQSTAVEVVKILQREVDLHESDLKAEQQSMLKLRQANPDLALQAQMNGSGQNGSPVTRLGELSQQLTAAEIKATDVKYAAAAVKSGMSMARLRHLLDDAGLSATVTVGPDPQALADYRQAAANLDRMSDTLGPAHPSVQQARRLAGKLKADVDASAAQSTAAALESLRDAQESADARVDHLRAVVEDERRSALKLNDKGAEYDLLAQQEQRTERYLDLLDSRIKDVNVNEDVGSLTVSVLETARAEGGPVRPRRGQIMGAALVIGVMAGLAGAMLRDLSDQRLRSSEEIASTLDLAVLGAVPHMVDKLAQSDRGRESHMRPRSDVAESYRTVRTAIYFGGGQDGSTKTLLVTSPSPGDGKSTSASNLAITMAQAGRRTLLIDADCRRPVQHKIFKLKDGPGLSTVLAGRATLDQAVQRTDVERLDLLPCGPLPPNPAELLDSQAFVDLLALVSERYDQVLIDSPPVVPVTDARIIAASCHATVLVLRAEKSTRRLAGYAREGLASVGAGLLGVIVNDVPRGKDGYGYYYYGYGGYSGYGTYDAVASTTTGDANGYLAAVVPATNGAAGGERH